eukprot:4806916-Pyramimonas_sp.AAC.1
MIWPNLAQFGLHLASFGAPQFGGGIRESQELCSVWVPDLAGSGAQDVSVAVSLETPVCCGITDRQELTPRVICSQGLGVRCEHLLVACLLEGMESWKIQNLHAL